MTCAEVLDRLDDYLDGTLGEAEFQEVESHLHDCAACRDEERLLRALVARAAALPKEMAPPRDLWPGIADRLEPRRRVLAFPSRLAARPVWLAAAAAVLVALIAGVLLRPGAEPESRVADRPRPGATLVPAAGGGDPFAAAEAEYAQATNELLAALEARRGTLSPETAAVVDENLRVIDEALANVRAALRQDPENPQLNRMLASTHRRKIDVLQRVVKLSTRL